VSEKQKRKKGDKRKEKEKKKNEILRGLSPRKIN
jgi:hypothetical protein